MNKKVTLALHERTQIGARDSFSPGILLGRVFALSSLVQSFRSLLLVITVPPTIR